MRVVHGLITLIAAVVVIVFGSTWLMSRYDVGPDTGIWNTRENDLRWLSEAGRVPIAGPAKLAIPRQYTASGLEGSFGEDLPIIPVSIGSLNYYGGFNSYSRSENVTLAQGEGCVPPTVNLLLMESANAGQPIFDRRVLISHFAYLEQEDERLLFTLVAEADTNKDSFLSCLDAARFHIKSLRDSSEVVLDRNFIPDDLSSVRYDFENRRLSFVERKYVGDKVHQKKLTVSFDGEIISEDEIPDLLSEAKKAFERTIGDR